MLEFKNVTMNEEGSVLITTYDLSKKKFKYILMKVCTDAAKPPFAYDIFDDPDELDKKGEDGVIPFPKPHKRVSSRYIITLVQNMYASLYNNILIHDKNTDYRIVNPKE